jgi:hypothetical protein
VKIEEYTSAVKAIYPGRRVRDVRSGRAGWLSSVDEQGFHLKRDRYEVHVNNNVYWSSSEVEFDESIKIGDNVTTCSDPDPRNWNDDVVAVIADDILTMKTGRKVNMNDVLPR